MSPTGNQDSVIGMAVSVAVRATDSAAGGTPAFSATGLPPGLSMAPSGLVSGTPTAVGSYTVSVNAFDPASAPGSATFTWAITSPGGGIVNGGFESGSFFGWVTSGVVTSIVSSGQHSGSHAAQAGSSTDATYGDSTLTQDFSVPAGDGKLSFWST